jgi:hypothetical protein
MAEPFVELLIHAPGYVGHQARAALVRLADTQGVPLQPDLLHARPNGQPAPNTLPAVRFFGTGKTIRLIGVGSTGEELLYRDALQIMRVLRQELGHTPEARYQSGTLDLRHLPYPVRHRVDAFVMAAPSSVRQQLREGTRDGEPLRLATARLTDALTRQLAWLGYAVPTPTISEVSIRRSVAVACKTHWRAALDLVFMAPCEFVGPWQLGALQARGYGRLHRDRPARAAA